MDMSFKDMSADAFERLARRQVDRAFVGLPDDPDAPLPWIGHFPHERAVQKEVVLQALRAVRWAESELPPWMLPLLLKAEDCVALFNGPHQGDRRSALRGEYGLELRSLWWDISRARPFEIFCAGRSG
jgi:hypothetical protein